MTSPPTHTASGWKVDESARAAVMAAYELEALRDSAALKKITDFAAALCECPVSLVSLVEETRQTFIARSGIDLTETPREVSFCAHAMLGDDVMVVPDATQDPRFADNALVTGAENIRFYAGAPLVTEDGVPLGSLCVIDAVPHPQGLSDLQRLGCATIAMPPRGATPRTTPAAR
jgi:GAF domain-containing protein